MHFWQKLWWWAVTAHLLSYAEAKKMKSLTPYDCLCLVDSDTSLLFVIVVLNSRFLQRPQTRSHRSQLIHTRISRFCMSAIVFQTWFMFSIVHDHVSLTSSCNINEFLHVCWVFHCTTEFRNTFRDLPTSVWQRRTCRHVVFNPSMTSVY